MQTTNANTQEQAMDFAKSYEEWATKFDTSILHNRKESEQDGATYVSGVFEANDGSLWQVETSDINGTESFGFLGYAPAEIEMTICPSCRRQQPARMNCENCGASLCL
jgi:hypothetical protein